MFSGAAHEGEQESARETDDEQSRFADSTKINQLLSVLMPADAPVPPPTFEASLPVDETEFRHPQKSVDVDFEKKRKLAFAFPEGTSRFRPSNFRSRSGRGDLSVDASGDGGAVRAAPSGGADEGEQERDPTHGLHLDDEDHEWFRTLFRSSITPRDTGGASSFADAAPPQAASSNFDDNFSSAFPFSPGSPMFHNSARLTPSRRNAPFFSPDMDMTSSPRREYLNSGSNLNRDFLFGDGDIPAYEPRMKELSLPQKKGKKRKKQPARQIQKATSALEPTLINPLNAELSDREFNISVASAEASNPLQEGYTSVVPIHPEQEANSEQAEFGGHMMMPALPSIPASLLRAPVHEEVHIKLDPIIPLHIAGSVVDASLSASSLLPGIPKGFLESHVPQIIDTTPNVVDNTSGSSRESLSTSLGLVPTLVELGVNSQAESVEVKDLILSPDVVISPEAVKEIENILTKAKRKTINMLVQEIISLLDVNILLNYEEGAQLCCVRVRQGREDQNSSSSSSGNAESAVTSRQPNLDAVLRLDEVVHRLSSKDVRDLSAGNLSATSIAKVLGESHHRRVWEVLTMMSVLGLIEQSPQRNYVRRCADDMQMINQLALLQNEAIFQFPRDAVANGIVENDFFKTQKTLLFKLQSSLAQVTSSSQADSTIKNGEDYDHTFYYREVLKIFLCGNKVTVPDIRRIFLAQGCDLKQSGERRLYDAIAVMLSVRIVKRHEDPLVYISSVAKRVYTWCFYDLKDIRQLWLKAET